MGNNHSGKLTDHLVQMIQEENYAQNRKQQRENMQELFSDIDKSNTGRIEQKEIEKLFDVVIEGYQKAADEVLSDDMPNHKALSPKDVARLYRKADKEKDSTLSFNEFMEMVDNLYNFLLEGKNIDNLAHIASHHKPGNKTKNQ